MKLLLISVVHIVAAAFAYWHLISGGWLTTATISAYRLNDPNIVNLMLAIFEPIAVASVIVYWLSRRPFFYRLMSILCLVQLLIGTAFLIFILLFIFTWHPRMM